MGKVEAGDIFLLAGTGWVDRIINFFQALYSGDTKSEYTHCGVVLGEDGTVFETTRWRTSIRNLFADSSGSQVKILRWSDMSPPKVELGYMAIEDQLERIYPYHRLALFALGLARWLHWKGMVCSEIVACFLAAAGERDGYWGVNVDQLNDEYTVNREWEVVYVGKPKEM